MKKPKLGHVRCRPADAKRDGFSTGYTYEVFCGDEWLYLGPCHSKAAWLAAGLETMQDAFNAVVEEAD